MYDMVIRSEASGSENQDRADIIKRQDGLLIIVADGAGGTGEGSRASETAKEFVRKFTVSENQFLNPLTWKELLYEIDQKLFSDKSPGETTMLITALRDDLLCGASVGDSQAWDINDHELKDITEYQNRKPLLGSGTAVPVSFGIIRIKGTLLLGTDGLFKYISHNEIIETVKNKDIGKCADQLIEKVRLPSGSLWDDVTTVICKRII